MGKKILVTVIVLVAFQDKYDHKTQYAPSAELEVEKERADDLISRGLAELKKEPVVNPSDTQSDEKKSAKGKNKQSDQEKEADAATVPAEEEKKEVKEEENATATV